MTKNPRSIPKTITDLNGVFADGIHCGLKAKDKDLALIYVPEATACAGVFTQNRFKSSCVHISAKAIKKGSVKAIIINAGNANAGTGAQGEQDSWAMIKQVASGLGLKKADVAVASTGIVGKTLPMSVISQGIDALLARCDAKDGFSASEAILTTDTFPKNVFHQGKVGKKTVTVAGMSKGSGMIAPNMATTLTFVVTDMNLPSSELQRLFSESINKSFNMISVDSDTSSNDMALIISTGAYKAQRSDASQMAAFSALLDKACLELALQVLRDGEGASRLFEVRVEGAVSDKDARLMAKSIVDSPLVKTAIHGADANWGRVLVAAGKADDVKFNQDKVSLSFAGVEVFKEGTALAIDRDSVSAKMAVDKVDVVLSLGLGQGSATAWGCDLSKTYVDINTAYS